MAESKAAKARVEYRRELQRINRQLNKLSKEGKAVPAAALPKPVKRPSQKTVERLKRVKGAQLRKISKPIEEFTGAVPAEPYKLPPTEKQLQRAKKAKKPTSPKRPKKTAPQPPPPAPAPASEPVAELEPSEEPEGRDEEYPTRAQLVYERFRTAIDAIGIPLFRHELLNVLDSLTEDELLSKWDTTADEDRKSLEDFAEYVNNVFADLQAGGHSEDTALQMTIERCYHRFDLVYYILTNSSVPADIAAAANDIIMGV